VTGEYERLAEEWLSTQESTNTRSAYRADLAVFDRWCVRQKAIPLRISAADVASYQAACVDAGESASTIRRRSSSLSSFFQFALSRDVVAANPVTGSNRPPVELGDPSPTPSLRAASVESHLRDAAELDDRLHALVALLALDGVKLGEALALDVTDISGRTPRIAADVSRPGGRQRLVLHPEAGGAVRRCAAGRRSGPLFVSGRPGGEPTSRLTRFGADHLIKRLPTNGTPLTANALRRFYVSSSHAAGVDIDEIRERAGLADARSARRYLSIHNNNQAAGDGSGRRPTTKEV
jgi:site-specific recombinase XerD